MISSELSSYFKLEDGVIDEIVSTTLQQGGPLRDAVIDNVVGRIKDKCIAPIDNTSVNVLAKTIDIPECLSFQQENKLIADYPELIIKFTKTAVNQHAYAAASRRCEAKILFNNKLRMKEFRSDVGVTISDIGSNFYHHFKNENIHVHAISPVVDARDQERFVSRRCMLDRYVSTQQSLTSFKTKYIKDFNSIIENGNKKCTPYVCTLKAEHCRVKTKYGVMLHSCYDIPLVSVAQMMINKDMREIYGTFIWHPEILLSSSGYLPDCEVYYEYDQDEDWIKFSFVNDSSFVYCHSLSNYLSYIGTTTFTDTSYKKKFFIEFLENRSCIQFFKITMADDTTLFNDSLIRALWFPRYKEKKIVYYMEMQGLNGETLEWSDFGSFIQTFVDCTIYKKKKIIVEAELVEKGIEYAYRVHPDKFKPIEIYSYLQSHNRRLYVGGKEIISKPNIEKADRLFILANVIYLNVYVKKFMIGKMVQKSVAEIDYNRTLLNKTLIKKYFSQPPSVSLLEDLSRQTGVIAHIRKFLHLKFYNDKKLGLEHMKTIIECNSFCEVSKSFDISFCTAFNRVMNAVFKRDVKNNDLIIDTVSDAFDLNFNNLIRNIIEKNFDREAAKDKLMCEVQDSIPQDIEDYSGCIDMRNCTNDKKLRCYLNSVLPHPKYKTMVYNDEVFELFKIERNGLCFFTILQRFYPFSSIHEILCLLSDLSFQDIEVDNVYDVGYFFKQYSDCLNTGKFAKLRFPLFAIKYIVKIFDCQIILHDEMRYNYLSFGLSDNVIHMRYTTGHVDLLLPVGHKGCLFPQKYNVVHHDICQFTHTSKEFINKSSFYQSCVHRVLLHHYNSDDTDNASYGNDNYCTMDNNVTEFRPDIKMGVVPFEGILAHEALIDIGSIDYDRVVFLDEGSCDKEFYKMFLKNFNVHEQPRVRNKKIDRAVSCDLLPDAFESAFQTNVVKKNDVEELSDDSLKFCEINDCNQIQVQAIVHQDNNEEDCSLCNAKNFLQGSLCVDKIFSDADSYNKYFTQYIQSFSTLSVAEIYDQINSLRLKNKYDTHFKINKLRYVSRSAYKLVEIIRYMKLNVAGVRTLDMCGAPGGFLEVLLEMGADVISFSSATGLKYNQKFVGHASVRIRNVLRETIDYGYFDLIVADGAVERSYIDDSIFDAELEIAIRSLRKNGNLVIKHSNHLDIKQKYIDLLMNNFGSIEFYKPVASAYTNSEIYILCKDFGNKTNAFLANSFYRSVLGLYLVVTGLDAQVAYEDWVNNILSSGFSLLEYADHENSTDINVEKVLEDIFQEQSVNYKKYNDIKYVSDSCDFYICLETLPVITKRSVLFINNLDVNFDYVEAVTPYYLNKDIYYIITVNTIPSRSVVDFPIDIYLSIYRTLANNISEYRNCDNQLDRVIGKIKHFNIQQEILDEDVVITNVNSFDILREVNSMSNVSLSLISNNGNVYLRKSANAVFDNKEVSYRFANLLEQYEQLNRCSVVQAYYSYQTNSYEIINPVDLNLSVLQFVQFKCPASVTINLIKSEQLSLHLSDQYTLYTPALDSECLSYISSKFSKVVTMLVIVKEQEFEINSVVAAFSDKCYILYIYRSELDSLVDYRGVRVPLKEVASNYSTLYQCAMDELRKYWSFEKLAVCNNLKPLYQRVVVSGGCVPVDLIDSTAGVYDLVNRDWIIKPLEIQKYSSAYDGNDIVTFNKQGDYYTADTHKRIVVVSKDTVFLSGSKLYEGTLSINTVPQCKFILRSGAPGSGKTSDILSRHEVATKYTIGDLVLTATREAAIDLQNRIKTMYPDITDSILKRKYRTIDSYLINGVDTCNTLYIDEIFMDHPGKAIMAAVRSCASVVIAYGDSAQIPFINRLRQMNLYYDNYRLYPWIVEARTHSYRCPRDVIALVNYMKLYPFVVYGSNNVKTSLFASTYKTIRSVEIPSNAQILVFTQSEKDDFRRDGFKNVLTVHEYQGNQTAVVVLIRKQTKPISTYSSVHHILVALTRHTVSLHYYTTIIDDTYKFIKKTSEFNLDNFYKSVTDNGVGGDHEWVCTDSEYMYTATDTVYEISSSKLTRDIAFSNTSRSWIPARFEKIFSTENFCRESFDNSLIVSLDVSYLQEVYDSIFPAHSHCDRRYEPLIVELQDVVLSTAEFVLRQHAVNYVKYDPDWFLTPVLRTGIQPRVEITPQQVAYAFSERNGGVPDYTEIVDMDKLIDDAYAAFENTFIADKQTYSLFESDELSINADEITEWLRTQKTDVKTSLENHSHILSDYNKHFYYFSLKRNTKPVLDGTGMSKISAPQTIAYMDKLINAVFCPMARRMKERLLRVLNKNFVINTDMSNRDFENLISSRFPPSLVKDLPYCIENDAGKYDKSQLLRIMLILRKFLVKFGLSDWLVDWWLAAIVHSVLRDFITGFSGKTFYQQKSGSPFTFLLNTVLMMIISSYLYDLKNAYGMVAGDDTYFFLEKMNYRNGVITDFASMFNLEVKPIVKLTPYFCSKFIMPVSEKQWVVLPDLAKVLTKLGRLDLVNFDHMEQYRISTFDNLNSYWFNESGFLLTLAMLDRYNVVIDGESVISTLYYYLSDHKNFSTLFYQPENYVVRNYCNLPSLDV